MLKIYVHIYNAIAYFDIHIFTYNCYNIYVCMLLSLSVVLYCSPLLRLPIHDTLLKKERFMKWFGPVLSLLLLSLI